MNGYCAYDVSQGYQREPRNVARNVARYVEEMSSEKPHGPKNFKRPVFHAQLAIDTSAIVQQQNVAFVEVCASELRSSS